MMRSFLQFNPAASAAAAGHYAPAARNCKPLGAHRPGGTAGIGSCGLTFGVV